MEHKVCFDTRVVNVEVYLTLKCFIALLKSPTIASTLFRTSPSCLYRYRGAAEYFLHLQHDQIVVSTVHSKIVEQWRTATLICWRKSLNQIGEELQAMDWKRRVSSFNIIFLPFVGNISPTECFEWIIILHLQYYRVS